MKDDIEANCQVFEYSCMGRLTGKAGVCLLTLGPDTVNEIVRIAFKYAESEKQGATHIGFPVDIAKMKVEESESPLEKSN